MASVVAYLHREKNMVHLDLHNKNFLINPSNNHITLLDFTAARIIGPLGFIEPRFLRHDFASTFCSPEMCLDRPYSFNADTWTLAQSFTQIMAPDRQNCIYAMMTPKERFLHRQAAVYETMMWEERGHLPPPTHYGQDML